jgi:Protein of unknown function (DUF1194)
MEVSSMTRFQVRKKLRKACSKAKNVAVETLSIGQRNVSQGKASMNFVPTCFPNVSSIYRLGATVMGLGTASAVLTLGVLSPSASFAATIVGTELVLSVDVSGSVSSDEFNLQRQGYVNAFRNSDIQNKITVLPGGIAATLSYWASSAVQSVPWTRITNAAEANAFADALAAAARPFGGGTDIDNAINYASSLIATNDFEGNRKVIDVSGDGVNSGSIASLQTARNNTVNAGITINGLAILNDVSNLDTYYANNVIGGPGAFVIAANNFLDFENAVTQKIGREITPDPVPEPFTILGSLAAGGIGVALRRKQKQQEKEGTKA